MLTTGRCFWLPHVKVQYILFHNGVKVEAARGDDTPSEGNGLAFGGGLFTGGWLLLRGHGLLERLFEDVFGRGGI